MAKATDNYFASIPEPAQGCLLALRAHVLHIEETEEKWSYGMPFYNYKGKRLCYLWTEKKTGLPYIGIVNGNLIQHSLLLAEKRSRMKIMLIDPLKDLPLGTIDAILAMAMEVHK